MLLIQVIFSSAKKGTMKGRGKRGKREEKSERARGKGKKKGKKGGKRGEGEEKVKKCRLMVGRVFKRPHGGWGMFSKNLKNIHPCIQHKDM